MTSEVPDDPLETARSVKRNLEKFQDGDDLETARDGFFQLALRQLDSLIALLDQPLPPGYDRYEPAPNPREAAEHISINLRAFGKHTPEALQSDDFRLAVQQLGLLIDRLPSRSPADDPYVDPRYDPRDCDCCGKQYRGPAVYCSRRCAYEDAV